MDGASRVASTSRRNSEKPKMKSEKQVAVTIAAIVGIMKAAPTTMIAMMANVMPSKLPKFVISVFQKALMALPSCRCRGPGHVTYRGAPTSLPASVTVLLDPCCPQPGETEAFDCALPGQEFFHRERVTPAGFVEAEKAAAYRRNHLRFPAYDPSLCAGRREIGHGQRTAVRSDHVAYTASAVFHSVVLHTLSQ